MNDLQIEQIKKVVSTFASLSNINDKQLCDNLINHLININIDDAMDYIIISLNDLVSRGNLKQEDVFQNASLLTSINQEKYPSTEDLLKRLQWLKSMNMEHPQIPLEENHRLVLESFDKFNQIIGTNFDCYYTGGLMGYLATNHQLERYHGDLDLLVNEEQLFELYNLIQESTDFEFISNMNHKEEHGHEFKIQYKGTPMSIGLFLFERKQNDEIVTKEYYHSNNNPNEDLLVNEQHLAPQYAKMVFSEQVREHNGIPYKMQSLESIYNAKKNSRPKDRYDAGIIKNSIDISIVYNLDTQKQDNYGVLRKSANNSIAAKMERKINNLKTYENNKNFDTITIESSNDSITMNESNNNQHLGFNSKLKEANETKEEKKCFDKRSQSEAIIANQIKEKNTAIKEQKEQEKSLDKPKTRELTKTTNSVGTSSTSGFINIVTLALISSFAISILNIIVSYICR